MASKENLTFEMRRYTEYFGFFGLEEVSGSIEFATFCNTIAEKLKQATWLRAEYLKKSREEAAGDQSQEDVARLAGGMTRQIIANYESGLTLPSSENIFKIYKVLSALGSESASRALLEIRQLDRESLLAGIIRGAKDIEMATFRQQKRKDDLKECDSDIQRIKEKLGVKQKRLNAKKEGRS